MLARLVSLLTLAAMLAHSILGCGWHHEHRAHTASLEAGSCCCWHAKSTTVRAPDRRGDSSAFEREHGSEPSSPEDHPGGCVEPRCVYVVHDDAPAIQHLALVTTLLPSPAPGLPSVSLPRAGFAANARASAGAAGKVRAHLQVWLI